MTERERKDLAALQMPSPCLQHGPQGLYLPGGELGRFPRLGEGLLIQKVPRKELRLFLGSSPHPRTARHRSSISPASRSLRWAGFCGILLLCFVLPWVLAAPRELQDTPVGSSHGHWWHWPCWCQPVAAAGSRAGFGASTAIPAGSLLWEPPAARSCPSIPSEALREEPSALCSWCQHWKRSVGVLTAACGSQQFCQGPI